MTPDFLKCDSTYQLDNRMYEYYDFITEHYSSAMNVDNVVLSIIEHIKTDFNNNRQFIDFYTGYAWNAISHKYEHIEELTNVSSDKCPLFINYVDIVLSKMVADTNLNTLSNTNKIIININRKYINLFNDEDIDNNDIYDSLNYRYHNYIYRYSESITKKNIYNYIASDLKHELLYVYNFYFNYDVPNINTDIENIYAASDFSEDVWTNLVDSGLNHLCKSILYYTSPVIQDNRINDIHNHIKTLNDEQIKNLFEGTDLKTDIKNNYFYNVHLLEYYLYYYTHIEVFKKLSDIVTQLFYMEQYREVLLIGYILHKFSTYKTMIDLNDDYVRDKIFGKNVPDSYTIEYGQAEDIMCELENQKFSFQKKLYNLAKTELENRNINWSVV